MMKRMMNISKWLHELKPVILMVVAQFFFAGVNVFYKLAAYDGMRLKVIIAYRFIFASAFLVPLALIFERLAYVSLYIYMCKFIFNYI